MVNKIQKTQSQNIGRRKRLKMPLVGRAIMVQPMVHADRQYSCYLFVCHYRTLSVTETFLYFIPKHFFFHSAEHYNIFIY